MKIAFYSDSFLPAVDGVVISMLNFRKELMRRGHEVHIYASGNSETERLKRKYSNLHVIRGLSFRRYPQYSIAFLPGATAIRNMGIDFDVAHLQTPFTVGVQGMIIAKVNKTPTVGTFHTMFTNTAVVKEYTSNSKMVREFIKRYSWLYLRHFYSRCDSILAPSDVISKMLDRRGIHNVGVVPNSVDISRFNLNVDGSKIRRALNITDREHMILFAGRVSREKNLEVMINAARLLKNENYRFVVAGTGPGYEHYTKMVDRAGLGDLFDFVGFVDNADLPEYYAAADAFCMPSTFETQGIVTLEAMACGIPVIGADYLALKDLIVNGENGEKFPAGDYMACARKIRKVINNIESYKGMWDTAKQYSLQKTTDRLLDAYKNIIR